MDEYTPPPSSDVDCPDEEMLEDETEPIGHWDISLVGIMVLEDSIELETIPAGGAVLSIGMALVELQNVSVTVVIGPGG